MGYLVLVILPCAILVAIVVVPTAVLAFLVAQFRFARLAPDVIFPLIGSVIPVLMVVLAFLKSPSSGLHDGVPPEVLLMSAAVPAWLVCLATSHFVGRRFARGKA